MPAGGACVIVSERDPLPEMVLGRFSFGSCNPVVEQMQASLERGRAPAPSKPAGDQPMPDVSATAAAAGTSGAPQPSLAAGRAPKARQPGGAPITAPFGSTGRPEPQGGLKQPQQVGVSVTDAEMAGRLQHSSGSKRPASSSLIRPPDEAPELGYTSLRMQKKQKQAK